MDNIYFNAINQLIKVNCAHKCAIEAKVAEIGIHRTQHRILMYLSREGKLPSQKRLAEYFGITPAAVTGALQKLEADGYILRTLGEDNRFNEIIITEKGKEVVEQTKFIFSQIDKSLFEGFSHQEVAEFTAYLYRMIENTKGDTK